MKLIHLLSLCALIICTFAYDWTTVKQVVSQYYSNGAFPGAVLRVANTTHTLLTFEIGYLSKDSHTPYTQQTIFDLASLTKVTATLSSVMRLHDQGKFQLTDQVIKYIPQYNNHNKSATTIENLLLHNAGLAPDHPDPAHTSKEDIIKWTLNCSLTYPIGSKMVYSDLSFILLGILVERWSGQALDVYAKQTFELMGLRNSTFLPSSSLLYGIAPTEYSSKCRDYIKAFRKHLIRGEVHDPTAYSFAGVAGHAGFFSIAEDLEKYMQVHLRKGKLPDGKQFYKQSTVETFYTRVDGLPYQNRRALGWDTVPIQANPPCGHLFSPNSFGHTGYTGTSIWADRDKQLIITLLTNRVFPTDISLGIIEARAMIADEIVKAWQKG